MRSEAVSSLRNWAKDRLGEQEDLLRSVERAIVRLEELDHERSQVVVADTAGLGEPYPIQTLEGGDLHVLGWINEQSFLFTAHDMDDNITTIWRIDYDGSLPTELIEAQFLGFIPLD